MRSLITGLSYIMVSCLTGMAPLSYSLGKARLPGVPVD
jgi:hypothetical protein